MTNNSEILENILRSAAQVREGLDEVSVLIGAGASLAEQYFKHTDNSAKILREQSAAHIRALIDDLNAV